MTDWARSQQTLIRQTDDLRQDRTRDHMVRTRNEWPFIASYVGEGTQEDPAQWVVSVSYSAGLNTLRDRIWQSLRSDAQIKTIEA